MVKKDVRADLITQVNMDINKHFFQLFKDLVYKDPKETIVEKIFHLGRK